MHVTYFPEGAKSDYKVFSEDSKLIAEGFKSKGDAYEYIAKETNQNVYDIYVIWNREVSWAYYDSYLGDEGLEEYKNKVLYQGDGARVKKVKSILRE